jgi:four helix bundle protein
MGDYRGLRAWQESNRLAHCVFDLAEKAWRPQNAPIFDQLRRASLSVSLNLAEGHAYGAGGRCRAHFRIAYGSAVETEACLRFLDERGMRLSEVLEMARSVRALTYRLWQRSRPSR